MRVHRALHGVFCDLLAAELHLDICQKLTAAKLELDILALELQENELLEGARASLSESIRSIRELMEALTGERGE